MNRQLTKDEEKIISLEWECGSLKTEILQRKELCEQFEIGLQASDEARSMLGDRIDGLVLALKDIQTCPGRSCQTERIASVALLKFGSKITQISS